MLEEFERVIVVDWSCPQKSGDWAEDQGAQVVRRTGEKFWYISKARNLGARAVETRSICFLDADTLVLPGLRLEIEAQLNLSTMVIASRRANGLEVHDLGGFIALDIGHFWGVKGYNENLSGYALEDCYLRAQLCLELGLKVSRVSPGIIAAIRHSNELRGQYHSEPIEVAAKRNYDLLTEYLISHGVGDWITDPRTMEVAHRV